MRARVAVAVLCLGCTQPPLREALPFESVDRSVVVVVETAEASRYFAFEAGEARALPPLEASDGDPLRLTVLGYDAPLEVLGFSREGVELVLASADGAHRSLSGWPRAQTRVIGLDEDSGWGPLSPEVERALRDVRVAASPPCRAYKTEFYGVEALSTDTAFEAVFTDGEAHAIATKGALWYRFDETRFEEIPSPIPGLTPSSATNAPDGAVFVAGARGGAQEVWRRAPSAQAFERLPGTPAMQSEEWGEAIRWMSAISSEALWTLTKNGRLSRYAAGRWEDRRQLEPIVGGEHGSIAAVSADGVDVLHPYPLTLGDPNTQNTRRWMTLVRGSLAKPIALDESGIHYAIPNAISRDAAMTETFLGGTDGRLFAIRDESVTPVDVAEGTLKNPFPVRRLYPVRSAGWSGVVAVGGNGQGYERFENGAICRFVLQGMDAGYVVPLGPSLLVLGQRHPTPEQREDPARPRTPAGYLVVREIAP